MGIPGLQWDEVAPGKHKCIIADAENAVSSTGNPMVKVRLLVDEDEQWLPFMTNFSMLPQAQFKFRSFLRVMGFSKDHPPEDVTDFVDKEFIGLFADQNGRVSLVDWMRDLGGEDIEEDEKPVKKAKKPAPVEEEEDDEEEEEPTPPRKPKSSSASKARDF
jgi:hypothetical protein